MKKIKKATGSEKALLFIMMLFPFTLIALMISWLFMGEEERKYWNKYFN